MSLSLTNQLCFHFLRLDYPTNTCFCSCWQDQCHEFRGMVSQDGKLICTKENNPVRGPDGKMHANKCAMCQSILYVKRFINQYDNVMPVGQKIVPFNLKLKALGITH